MLAWWLKGGSERGDPCMLSPFVRSFLRGLAAFLRCAGKSGGNPVSNTTPNTHTPELRPHSAQRRPFSQVWVDLALQTPTILSEAGVRRLGERSNSRAWGGAGLHSSQKNERSFVSQVYEGALIYFSFVLLYVLV